MLGRARMDDDLFEIHCGKCGRLLTIDLSDLGMKRTVECSACQAAKPSSGGGAERIPSPRLGESDVITPSSWARKRQSGKSRR